MSDSISTESDNLKTQRDRRKRVARIKTFILSVVAIWMIVSAVIIAMLCVKVVLMQRQLDDISGENMHNNPQTNASGSQPLISQSSELIDNLADVEDVHKVYLTFDDGPSENSNAILDVLDDYGVKATFFVIGKTDEASKDIYKRIVAEGHTIGMHSYSHKYSEIYSSLDSFKQDLSQIQNLIYDTTGVESNIYRFPGGSSNKVSNVDMSQYIQYLNESGIKYFDWNVSSGDATSRAYTADELVENVMRDVVKYKASIVLMHDAKDKSTTVEALPKMIESLQQAGVVILPIDRDTTAIQHVSIPR